MPQVIHLIRHAETEDNVNGVFQGWRDADLNEKGVRQAEKLAKKLRAMRIDAVYSSDLKRAYQTALPLAQALKLDTRRTKDMREHGLGEMEGWKWGELQGEQKQVWDGFVKARQEKELDWRGHEGETMSEFYKRIRKFFKHVTQHNTGQHIAVFTHSGTKNRILEVLGLRNLTDNFISFGNTAITTLVKNKNKYLIE